MNFFSNMSKIFSTLKSKNVDKSDMKAQVDHNKLEFSVFKKYVYDAAYLKNKSLNFKSEGKVNIIHNAEANKKNKKAKQEVIPEDLKDGNLMIKYNGAYLISTKNLEDLTIEFPSEGTITIDYEPFIVPKKKPIVRAKL